MKKLALLLVVGLMLLGLQDFVQRTIIPEPAETITAWAKLKEMFH